MSITGKRADDLDPLSLPLVGTDRMFHSSAAVMKRADATKWHGGFLTRKTTALVKPATTDFGTWLNQVAATLTDNGDALSLEYDDSITTGTSVSGKYRNLPSGNWDVQIGTKRLWTPKEYLIGGLFLYESATGKIEFFGHGHSSSDSGLQCTRFTNSTTFFSDRRQSFEYVNPAWFRAKKTQAGEYRYYFSPDGVAWGEFTNRLGMNNWFTTAPDKWGFCLQPVNNGSTNKTGMRMDIFDWAEASETDAWPGVCSVENIDGWGDRTARITVSTTASLGSGTINNLVDNDFTSNSSGSFQFTNGQSGQSITFQFAEAKVIDQAKWFQRATGGHGTWKWQGSNDGSSYTDLSSGFTLDGGTTGSTIGDLSANTTAYLYYRLLQTSGTTSSTPWVQEIYFSIRKG